jgi:hypothetical protein
MPTEYRADKPVSQRKTTWALVIAVLALLPDLLPQVEPFLPPAWRDRSGWRSRPRAWSPSISPGAAAPSWNGSSKVRRPVRDPSRA